MKKLDDLILENWHEEIENKEITVDENRLKHLFPRANQGGFERQDRKLSLTIVLWGMIKRIVPAGKRRLGTPFVELAVRTFIAVLTCDLPDIIHSGAAIKTIFNTELFRKGLLALYTQLADPEETDE